MFRNLTSQGFSNLVWSLGKARFHNATAQTALVQRLTEKLLADDPERVIQVRPPPPPRPRTKWTRRVPHPVLIGHAAPLTPYPPPPLARACTHAARCCAPPWQGARLPPPAPPRPARGSPPRGGASWSRSTSFPTPSRGPLTPNSNPTVADFVF